jgi:chromosome segregation ATPase
VSCALEQQASEFSKQAESYESEIKDLKWAIVRNNDSISELEYQLKEHNAAVLKLNEDIMARTQRHTALEESLRQTERQAEQYERERNSLTVKIKELSEVIRVRQIELEEEKKARVKSEQRAEDEREKSRQLLSFGREKEAQEEERTREREAVLVRRQEEVSALELELTKRREEVASLKSSVESVLREIQLSKLDNDNVKSELNLMEANYKALKGDHSSLLKAQEALSNNLDSTE